MVKKIGPGYVRFDESHQASGLTLNMTVDRIDGQDLDTSVEVSGGFAISGQQRREFAEKLESLINEYRI